MPIGKHRNRNLHFESLERRAAPSAVVGVTPAAGPAAVGHISLPFIAVATATLTQMQPRPGGGSFISYSVAGDAYPSGIFRGQFLVTTSNNGPADVDAVLHSPGGSLQLTMIVGGSNNNGPSPTVPLLGTFTIMGGTGLYVHASGCGSVSVLLNQSMVSLTVKFDGEVIV